MKTAIILVNNELLREALHLPEGIEIVRAGNGGALDPPRPDTTALYVCGDALPDEVQGYYREIVKPMLETRVCEDQTAQRTEVVFTGFQP